MDQDKKRSEEILNTMLKLIADRNERFAIIEEDLEELKKSIYKYIEDLRRKTKTI